MSTKNTRKAAERLYMLFADALYSAEPTDTAAQMRNRLFRDVNDEERAALEALVAERRATYNPPVEVVEAPQDVPAKG